MTFAVGSLVKARGREWVVLPESDGDLLIVRPLGGTDGEVTGILKTIELVEPAQFDMPNPEDMGDHRSSKLLRDAVRLSFRNSAGPFRSFGRIAVEPRPYQLVPLMMALRLDPVRLLIADDVGIGKTIEACLIARELLDRGEVRRMTVLCPPHLAEQWQKELAEKFHLDAELVLPSTASRLEKWAAGQPLFEVNPYTVVSMDFIKQSSRRTIFVNQCPELVIIDEAHTCTDSEYSGGSRQQRHQLIKDLTKDPRRHIILVTATPHSGKEDAFRSLLSLLDDDFKNLPDDLTGDSRKEDRRRLAAQFVQRRRADITHFLNSDTPFPSRKETEETYSLTPEYRALFNRVLDYAEETVGSSKDGSHRQRVRWWSALALLRALASSPAAAAATLENRSAPADTDSVEEADQIGKRMVLDQSDDDLAESLDISPGGDIGDKADDEEKSRRRLRDMAKEAKKLFGEKDSKLKKLVDMVKTLTKEGYSPIVFCRFINTAEYVCEELRKKLPKVEIMAVTGTLAPADRELRIMELSEHSKGGAPVVLVATDCLSEGINLQKTFNAVIHYDLAWNPTRHEQREGRVDRYGQPNKEVRVVTYYGKDNQIDGIVLDVLINKHKKIRSALGVSVPVPIDTNQVIEAIFEGLLLRRKDRRGEPEAVQLNLLNQLMVPQKEQLFKNWEAVSEKEKRSRTMFAQDGIKVEEVAAELEAVRSAVGSGIDVERFVKDAMTAHGAIVTESENIKFNLKEIPRALSELIGFTDQFTAKFSLPITSEEIYLNRTHPVVDGLAQFIMNGALDPLFEGKAKRAGVIRTSQVIVRTIILLIRARFHIVSIRGSLELPILAEECILAGFTGAPERRIWLQNEQIEPLLSALPQGNVPHEQGSAFVKQIVDNFDELRPELNKLIQQKGDYILAQHKKVRDSSLKKGPAVSFRVEPQFPADVLGIYVFLPTNT
jgi:superfamily II DNA or RNA helicase